jgi:hypothetical protein
MHGTKQQGSSIWVSWLKLTSLPSIAAKSSSEQQSVSSQAPANIVLCILEERTTGNVVELSEVSFEGPTSLIYHLCMV